MSIYTFPLKILEALYFVRKGFGKDASSACDAVIITDRAREK